MPCAVTPVCVIGGCPPTTSSVAAGISSRRRANARSTAGPFLRSQSMPTKRKCGTLQSRSTSIGLWLRPTPTTCTFSGATP